MKSDRRAPKQELQASSHRHQNSKEQNQLKCSKCKSVPKKPRSVVCYPKKQVVKQRLVNNNAERQAINNNSTHSKSMHEAWHDPFDNDNASNVPKKKDLKRQSNSYCKFLQDKSHYEESTLLDNFFELKYKESQNELVSTKSKLFENECQVDSLVAELKKLRKENKMLHEKTSSLEQDNQGQSKKSQKYKHIARSLKMNLTQTTSSLESMKKLSTEEIKSLGNSVSMMEKMVKQRSIQYVTNLKTIQSYLIKIQRMMAPSDQNYSFNVKVIQDLTDLCSQLTKMTIDEEQSLKESLNSNYINSQYRTNKNEEIDFIFSQTTTNEFNTISSQANKQLRDDYSSKTKRLLDNYEKMKNESEYLKKENVMLKVKNDEISFLINEDHMKQFDSKQSERTRNHQQQSLSVADLIQLDSVCKVNSKLEQKNQYLEEQIIMMKIQMDDLVRQTQELQNDRDKQRHDEDESEDQYEKRDVMNEYVKTKKVPLPTFKQNDEEGKTQKLYQDHFNYQQSPSEQQSDICAFEKESIVPPFQNNLQNNVTMSVRNFMRPSQSSSHIDSSRGGLSKLTSASGSKRKNVFKKNCYLDSDKENLTSARDNSNNGYLKQQQHLIQVFNYDEQQQLSKGRPSFANTLSSTSPNVFGGKSLIDRLNKQNTNVSNNTFRKPMSMGSTSTLVINEKAKVLRDEISTLDDEIIQLQNNLKKAIKRKDSKKKI